MRVLLVPAACVFAVASACSREAVPATTYFERNIAPVLQSSCSRTSTGAGCHVANEKGNAFGNLDTTSFASLDKRRDLLAAYGPFGQPALLLKAIEPQQVRVESYDGTITTVTTDIKHTGGSVLEPTAGAYATLRRWLDNGATENNGARPDTAPLRAECSPEVPATPEFNDAEGAQETTRADFQTFAREVNGVLRRSCAAGNCHGTSANAMYITCGDTPEQLRWNYHSARAYLGSRAEVSELVRRPLAPAQGGAFHEGGVIYTSRDDGDFRRLEAWAEEHGPLDTGKVSPGFAFFAQRVLPTLVRKGCMMQQCHSSSQFHDYRLRGGSGGAFSLPATRKNYQLSLAQVSLESEDPGASRLVAKNLYRPELVEGGAGLAHRGGPLFEDFARAPATPAACDALPINYDSGELDGIPAYCLVREWIRRERTSRTLLPLTGIVWVRRPANGNGWRPQDFDVYSPGADLRLAQVTLGGAGDSATLTVGTEASLTVACGLDPSTADIRRPSVSWEGRLVAFAARSSATQPFAVFTMKADGAECVRHPVVNAGPATANGLLVHNFDPAFSPPDGLGRTTLVFASTRGNSSGAVDYAGPQRTPADLSKPNADLFALEPTGAVRQLTYLLNMERMPSFMRDGRVIFTAEKRAPGFYQLAGRRINLDGADYHPLFAQRRSVGFAQMTEISELATKELAAVFSEPGTPLGAGALGFVNRSLGVDFQSSDPADYPLDASVLDPAAPASPEPGSLLRALRFPGETKAGLYRSPSALPGARVLASWAKDAAGDFDIVVVDAVTGRRSRLLGAPDLADVDAVALYGRGSEGIFQSALDEPNGHTRIEAGRREAEILILDMPLLASLLFQNTPTGRPLESDMKKVELWEDLPPAPGVDSFAAAGANVARDAFGQVYVRRRSLGELPLLADGSARARVPGGVPVLFKLPDTRLSAERNLPRWQRETTSFAPGEVAHQSFRRGAFDGLCGACHGAVSGRAADVAVRPDVLTQASAVEAAKGDAVDLALPPERRGPSSGP